MDEAGRGVSLKAGGMSARHRGAGGTEVVVSRDTHGAGGVRLSTGDAERRERRGPAASEEPWRPR